MNNLTALRRQKGLTQQEMADFLKISKPTYNHYENGRYEPNIENLIKLADFFHCSVDYLIGHQSSDIIYFDSLSSVQKKLVELIQKLNDEQGLIVIGYLSDMLKIPYEQVKPVRPW